jgi:hypothetical protein
MKSKEWSDDKFPDDPDYCLENPISARLRLKQLKSSIDSESSGGALRTRMLLSIGVRALGDGVDSWPAKRGVSAEEWKHFWTRRGTIGGWRSVKGDEKRGVT